MLRKLIIFLLLLAGLAGLLTGVAWYLLHDETFLKKQAHNWFLDSTGRTLTVNGPLTLELGSDITLEARQLSLSNASWGTQPDIAKVGRLLVTANLKSLFGGKPILRNVEIEDCTVDVAENDQGVSNWDLFASDETHPPRKKTETGLQEPVIFIDRARAESCQVTISSPRRKKPLLIKVTNLAMDLQKNGGYQAQAAGVFDGHPTTLDGTLGPIRALWQGGRFDHDVKLEVGDIRLHSSGTLADTINLTGANLSMNFTGPEFGAVIKALALPPFSSGKFDFDLDLNTESALTEVKINGDLGDLEVTVAGELDRLRHPTSGNLKLNASGPNLGALAETLGMHNLVQEPFKLSLESSVTKGRSQLKPLIVSTEKDRIEINGTVGAFPELYQTALDITLHSDDADRWTAPFKAISGPIGVFDAKVKLATDPTGITAIEAVVDQAGSHLETSGGMGRYPTLDKPDFTFSFDTPDLQATGKIFKLARLPAAPATVKGRIRKDDNGLHFDKVRADMEGDTFHADGLLNLANRLRGSKFTVEANIASTAKFGALLGLSDIPDETLQLKGVIQPEGNGLKYQVTKSRMGDMDISIIGQIDNLEHPALQDATFELGLPSLALLEPFFPGTRLPDLPFTASGQAVSTDELVKLQVGKFKLGQTTADVEGQFAPGQKGVGSSLKISATGTDWRELVSLPKLESLPHDFSLSGSWARTSQGDQLDGIEFAVGKMNLKLNGRADDLFALQGAALNAQAEIPDVSVFNKILDQSIEPQALSLSASLEGNPQLFDIHNLSAKLGSSDLAAELNVDHRARLKLSGSVESQYFDYRPFQKKDPKHQAEAATAVPKNPSNLYFDDTPVIALKESPLDIDLKIEVEKLDYGFTSLTNISLGILRQDRELQLDPFKVRGLKGSEISGKFLINGRGATPDMVLKLDGKDLHLGITSFKGQDPATIPPVEVHIDLHGAGVTRHEMARSMDGRIRMFSGSGLYAATGFNFLFSDFITELFETLDPFHKNKEYSKIDCGVLAADVSSGIVKINPILIQDEKITIVSEGEIHLDTEKIDLVFNTKPRTGLGITPGVIINSLVKVGGTLTAPAMELDKQGAVVAGTAAVATVGISLLAKSFSDRFLSSKDPCGDARKKLDEQDSKP